MQATDPHPHAPQQPQQGTDLACALRLLHTAGVGPLASARLRRQFGSAAAVFEADPAALRACVGAVLAQALLHPPAVQAQRVEAALAWAALPGNTILTPDHPAYPPALAQIGDPPPLLFASGRLALLTAPCLAVIGSRNATLQGKIDAEVFAQALSLAGLCIVSGLALGIDAAAHLGALQGSGATVAVVGTGHELCYPARNRALWQRIVAEGCVLSEYPPGTPPLAHNFPQRNRIISGLCAGVLVVEAAARSGSLITARLAASQGREVFAIPGSIHSALAKGCHLLLKEGARLVESAADVLAELQQSPLLRLAAAPTSAPEQEQAVSGQQGALLALMGHAPLGVEQLAGACGCAPHELGLVLLELELAGKLERLADGRYRQLRP